MKFGYHTQAFTLKGWSTNQGLLTLINVSIADKQEAKTDSITPSYKMNEIETRLNPDSQS